MTVETTFSTFYIVSISGEFARSLLPAESRIKEIKVVSKKLDTDFDAMNRLSDIKNVLTPQFDEYSILEKFNDLYTPKCPESVWLSMNRKDTEQFDDMGDLVFYKCCVSSDYGNVTFKALTDPDEADFLISAHVKMKNIPRIPQSPARIH